MMFLNLVRWRTMIAAGHLPPEGLRRFTRDPNFWQKAAGVKLRQHAGVDRVCLYLRVRIHNGDHDSLANRARHNEPRNMKRPALWSATRRNWAFSNFEHLPPNST
jgi:hypothetical protein